MRIEEKTAVEAIRDSFRRVISEGLKPEFMASASDDQIDAMAAAQGVVHVPAAAREVLRLIGLQHGLWLAGSSFGVTAVGASAKRNALATLRGLDHNPLADAEKMLVLLEHQAYSYHVVDGADLTEPDPPVWLITEGDEACMYWAGITDWFDGTAPDVDEYRSRLRLMREFGHSSVPPWAQYIRLDEDQQGSRPGPRPTHDQGD